MWQLLIGILIGIIITLKGCNLLAKRLQKKIENEIQIYEDVDLVLWIEGGNKMEVTWDLSQWEKDGRMMCHIIYCAKEMRAAGYANARNMQELLKEGPTIMEINHATVYQQGGDFYWEF